MCKLNIFQSSIFCSDFLSFFAFQSQCEDKREKWREGPEGHPTVLQTQDHRAAFIPIF